MDLIASRVSPLVVIELIPWSFSHEVFLFSFVSNDAADLADSGPILSVFNTSIVTRSKACQKKNCENAGNHFDDLFFSFVKL